MAKTIVSWQAFPSLPPRALLAPKTPFPFPFKRLPGTLDDSLLNQGIAYLTKRSMPSFNHFSPKCDSEGITNLKFLGAHFAHSL